MGALLCNAGGVEGPPRPYTHWVKLAAVFMDVSWHVFQDIINQMPRHTYSIHVMCIVYVCEIGLCPIFLGEEWGEGCHS